MIKLKTIYIPAGKKFYYVEFEVNGKRHKKSLKEKNKEKAYKAWEKIARGLDSSNNDILNNMPIIEAMADFLESRKHKLQPSSLVPERIKLVSFLKYLTDEQSIVNVSDTTINHLDNFFPPGKVSL